MDDATYLRFGIAVAMLVCGVLARVLQEITPGLVGTAMGLEVVEDRLFAMHAQSHDLHQRLAVLRAEARQHEWDRQSREQKERLLQRQIAEAARPIPIFVHEIGEPTGSARHFRCRVFQERRSAAMGGGRDNRRPDPIWRYTNIADIWARDFDQARHLAESSFPACLGYIVRFDRVEV